MLIETGKFTRISLQDQVAIVTGAGGGIGFETCRALLWLGARVVIAEIDKPRGRQAEADLKAEFGEGSALFVPTDAGNERSVDKLSTASLSRFGKVDIVINNATIAPLGAVKDVPIQDWDASYLVNLRAPVLMARCFIPGMIARSYGVFMCVSSLGQEYMAAYESMKAAQVHLGSTLAAELEGTGVCTFTIGPGYVPTRTAESSIPRLAKLMNKPVEEIFAIVRQYELSVEAAGAGFAAAVVLAGNYVGQEISSTQALMDAGIDMTRSAPAPGAARLPLEGYDHAIQLCQHVLETLEEQSAGWKKRPVFEAQWMLRSFRKQAGMPVEQWLEVLRQLEQALDKRDPGAVDAIQVPLSRLEAFYANMLELAKGYIKDPEQREAQLAIVRGWQAEVNDLEQALKG